MSFRVARCIGSASGMEPPHDPTRLPADYKSDTF